MRNITLVSCVSKKTSQVEQAEKLYQSQWFILASAYARSHSDKWAILSAKHGLVHPWEEIEPYEKTLNTMPINDRKQWANKIVRKLSKETWDHVTILAGKRYREFIVPWLQDNGHSFIIPMKGLGIGQQLKWLKENL